MKSLHIGFVYDCQEEYLAQGFSPEDVAEFDPAATIDAIAQALENLGHQVERVGHRGQLAQALAFGQRYDLVFNIAEGVFGPSREALVPALCELYRQPYTFSDPLTCALTLDKAMAKRIVRDAGLPTAPFALVEEEGQAQEIPFAGPYFLKPVAEGSSKGISLDSAVAERSQLPTACAQLLRRFGQPVLVERFLPGREVTVGILGNGAKAQVVGVMEVLFTEEAEGSFYTSLNKAEYTRRVRYRLLTHQPLAHQAAEIALACYRLLRCRDAARVDLRCDEKGIPHFLEANPLPGLDPQRSDLPILARLAGLDYPTLLSRILEAAWQRWCS
jgi:D-alanine-D-alanine ligase